jgi:glycosyltransferase involved in cell wall biosynthesis
LGQRAALVTIGMPTYNGARYLAQSLDSLLAQDYPNLELVISDNCSTDETERIARDYAARHSLIRYERSAQNRGAAANFNRVMELATGPYFFFAADHDLWAPSFVSSCVARLEANPQAVLAHPQTTLISMDGRPLEVMNDRIFLADRSSVARYRRLVWNLNACNMVYGVGRLAAFRRAGGFADIFGPDLVLLARMVLQGQVERVEEPLYFRRQNRAEETSDQERQRILADLNPATAPDRKKLPYQELMREVRDAHLGAVRGATTLSSMEKLEAAVATLACYRQRFGVHSRVLRALSPVSRVGPLRAWMQPPPDDAQA